jgi:hypothetical protein
MDLFTVRSDFNVLHIARTTFILPFYTEILPRLRRAEKKITAHQ